MAAINSRRFHNANFWLKNFAKPLVVALQNDESNSLDWFN